MITGLDGGAISIVTIINTIQWALRRQSLRKGEVRSEE
jgi:hypothetical protein